MSMLFVLVAIFKQIPPLQVSSLLASVISVDSPHVPDFIDSSVERIVYFVIGK